MFFSLEYIQLHISHRSSPIEQGIAKEKEKLECSGALDTDELNKTEEELEEEELDEIEELLDFGFLLRFS